MFEKFKNEDTDAEIPVTPKPEVKEFAQALSVEVPKPAASVDDESFVKKIIPDLTFRQSTATSPKAIFTVKTRNFPGEAYLQSDAKDITRSVAASSTVVEQFTNQVNLRLRGRSFAVKIESTDKGVAWRLGSPRLDVKPDGRR